MSELKDFYTKLDKEIEEEEEDDSDFVPEEESEDQDENGTDEEVEEEEEETSKASDAINRESAAKKSRIDAIWAEMNQSTTDKSHGSSDSPSKSPSTKSDDTVAISRKDSNIPTTSTNLSPNTIKTVTTETTSSTPNTSTESANTINVSSTSATDKPLKRASSILDQYHPKNKRPKSQLSALISKYNIKEPKMNTLEKSKLDWNNYVEKEGIKDELSYKNKDGYMEKVAFLQRVDDRRLHQLKEGQKSSIKKP
ncbi:bucentaur or craniofacial development-domain-containing protein [Mycotypha africana]|uniref:bucentaur or craniofacial development-domain-containing protein n=1 Tax=Mycotypha africana TaxID=64632 RepID=UPI002301D70E|nr:bucentaur or craniofacial development-domain-containing protein [Mycotypha africana]KAI8987499.1 bucentaur or craniofacial development-domain-containing protein [Mycotypha africana]